MQIKNSLTFVFACLLLPVLLAAQASAQPGARLGISPERYVVELGEGGSVTESLMVKNLSDEPVTVTLSVGNWELDENNRLRAIPPQEDSLDRWIVINPLRVTIPPNTPQTIRWAIMPRSRPQPGEYRAIIYIQEDIAEQDSTANAAIRLNMRMGIPIYAQVGEAIERSSVKVSGVRDRGHEVMLALVNDGNRHVRLQGSYGVWPAEIFPGREKARKALSAAGASDADAAGFVFGTLTGPVVLPGNQRETAIRPELDTPVNYVMQFDASFGDAALTESVELEYVAP